MRKIAPLFEGWNETLIWSCLQGHMGRAWADEAENPKSAQIVVADFCFFAGEPNAELVKNFVSKAGFLIMTPQNDAWSYEIEREYEGCCRRVERYAIKKEPNVFDEEKLRANLKNLPKDYTIRQIDNELYENLGEEAWSADFCSQFASYDEYQKKGLGFVVMHNGLPVSGASSYTVYDGGIEIEIDTKKEYRRKGLALAGASALILECLKRGLYPSWDAANRESVALSEKLGYHFDHPYSVYEVTAKPDAKPIK